MKDFDKKIVNNILRNFSRNSAFQSYSRALAYSVITTIIRSSRSHCYYGYSVTMATRRSWLRGYHGYTVTMVPDFPCTRSSSSTSFFISHRSYDDSLSRSLNAPRTFLTTSILGVRLVLWGASRIQSSTRCFFSRRAFRLQTGEYRPDYTVRAVEIVIIEFFKSEITKELRIILEIKDLYPRCRHKRMKSTDFSARTQFERHYISLGERNGYSWWYTEYQGLKYPVAWPMKFFYEALRAIYVWPKAPLT